MDSAVPSASVATIWVPLCATVMPSIKEEEEAGRRSFLLSYLLAGGFSGRAPGILVHGGAGLPADPPSL